VLFAGTFLGKSLLSKQEPGQVCPASTTISIETPAIPQYSRIVSLAPSITEVLFAIGLGTRVVGVTRYCKYPAEALKKPKVGGFFDPNYEAIVNLKPDLVIMLPEHEEAKHYFDILHLRTLTVSHASIAGIMDSIVTIGSFCGVESRAREMVANLENRMFRIKTKTEGLYRPRTLISVGRNMGSSDLTDLYVSGKDGFYNEMIMLAGGKNIYQGGTIAFPVVSGEGVLRLNPEVIIEMIPDLGEEKLDSGTLLKEWRASCEVDAVKKNRVYLFDQDYAVVPGPRFIFLLEKMARVLHPEVNWETS
jgi:iron complex transport system substrate-binding protein